ncbi:cytochrome-c peroxidase [Aliamphritea spongicola]|nr:cytochrome-c peroxidase [Aliamphritea spongicola]
MSCASCHQPENGYSYPEALSPGYPGSGHFRNSPTLINTVYKDQWFHDGRLGTNLNDVTREMITEDYLMNMDMRLMQERIKQDPVYVQMFKDAGYGEPSNGSVRKAIPEYLKTLTSRNVPFDNGTLSDAAKRGRHCLKVKPAVTSVIQVRCFPTAKPITPEWPKTLISSLIPSGIRHSLPSICLWAMRTI